jgi:adenosylhomocysteine nucleosidase
MALSNSILIVTALRTELEHPGVLYTGVGKLNAAYALTKWLQSNRPSLVVNYGTAGGLNRSVTGLVEVSRVIQADMVAEPLAPRGETPFDDSPSAFTSSHPGVICGSGDAFVTSIDPWLVERGVSVVDMELFAIAAVCHREGVPWRAFKYVTDYANEDSGGDWQANVHRGQAEFKAVLASLI